MLCHTERSSNDPRGMTPVGAGAPCGGSCGAALGAADCGCAPKGRSAGEGGCTAPNPAFSTEAEKAEREAEDNMLRMIHRMC